MSRPHAGAPDGPRSSRRAPKRLVILGATGSIGRSCAQVIGESPDRFAVVAVVGGRDGAALAHSARALGARFAAVADPESYADLREGLAGSGVEAAAGPAAVVEAALKDADLVVSAIVGAAGLEPTYAAVSAGRAVALANKETLVCAGDAVMAAARQAGGRMLPMDSEHNAIFQALGGRDPATIVRMTITASGGPFRKWSSERIAAATRAEALAHPNWAMGPKVTIDSATLMNKGLELIEAHHLFAMDPGAIGILVHAQSIVHGLVEYIDGSVVALMGSPDMRTPIAHCLAWPERIEAPVKSLDLAEVGTLSFEAPDLERFPALKLAREALEAGNGAPTVLNAANEIAVAEFIDRRLGFAGIPALVAATLDEAIRRGAMHEPASVEDAIAIDHTARRLAQSLVPEIAAKTL